VAKPDDDDDLDAHLAKMSAILKGGFSDSEGEQQKEVLSDDDDWGNADLPEDHGNTNKVSLSDLLAENS
jgi:hypothetical protein